MVHTINTALTVSTSVWTSELLVQGFQRVNVSFRVGGSAVQYPTLSSFSGTVRLQRKLPGDALWRDVQTWAVLASSGMGGSFEVITTSPEPESCSYRAGLEDNDWTAGYGFVRLGTS